MNLFFIRLLTMIATELRAFAVEHTEASTEEFDILFDASDAIEEAHDLLADIATEW